jgi:hypothetical protein
MQDDTTPDETTPKTWARGLPPHVPTDESRAQVAALKSFGIQQDEIALYLDIDPKTLIKYYRRELDIGAMHANARVAARLFETATSTGNDFVPASMYFWLKCRAGWREVPREGTNDETDIPPTTITVERKSARLPE